MGIEIPPALLKIINSIIHFLLIYTIINALRGCLSCQLGFLYLWALVLALLQDCAFMKENVKLLVN